MKNFIYATLASDEWDKKWRDVRIFQAIFIYKEKKRMGIWLKGLWGTCGGTRSVSIQFQFYE